MNEVIKKLFKGLYLSMLTLISIIILYAAITWLLFYFPVNRNAGLHGAKDLSIYVLSNGLHTDIVVPVKNEVMDWSKVTKFENTDSKDSTFRYAAFGWGDKGFYLETPQWSDLKVSTALKAISHLGSTAVHVDFIRDLQQSDHCKEIKISNEEYGRLVVFLKNSFKYDRQGKVIQVKTHGDGYGADDAFYEAKGAYDLFHTCNSWANDALLACGQKACIWTPVDKGILHQYN